MTNIKKFLPPVYFFVLAGIMLLSFLLRSNKNVFITELEMESDAMAIVNYYIPKRINLQDAPQERDLKLPEFKSKQPKFGVLILGNSPDSLITLALDELQEGSFSYIYIDKNNNEDLSDDGEPFWDEDKNGYWTKEALVDVHYKEGKKKAAVPYPITFYRYKHRLQDSIIAFRNGYRKGNITLKDSTYKIALLDDDLDGLFNDLEKGALIIDVNRDGILVGSTDSFEYFSLNHPFNINGITYGVKHITPAGNWIAISVADSLAPPKMVLAPGSEAPTFSMTVLDGRVINLLDLRDKVVLLDFWASWCKPWQEELLTLKQVYYRYHEQGFEIIGLNLDYDLDRLKEYLTKHRIVWPQITDGHGWEMPLVALYHVEAIPRNFLLDRNGTIRYKDLRGRNLQMKVRELLNEPSFSNLE
ncbi:MAG: TlpA family protein disulfide reductase [bacterium]